MKRKKEKWSGVEETLEIAKARHDVFDKHLKVTYFQLELDKAIREEKQANYELCKLMVGILGDAIRKAEGRC
jgi:hypothetical protein